MEDVFKLKVKRPKRPRKRTIDKAKDLDRKMVWITRKISRGDYDPENKSDVIHAQVAMCRGIIDKDLNILKEEFLLCQTQRKQQS